MRFRDELGVRRQEVFEETIREAIRQLNVKLVCIVQQGGVSDIKSIRRYLQWAKTLQVKDVVFREFLRTHELYRDNATLRAINSNRVRIEDLVNQIRQQGKVDFVPYEAQLGYYFWNVSYQWQNEIRVTLESSDYEVMKSRHQSDVLYKLIYHANGNLTGDWDPESCIVMATNS